MSRVLSFCLAALVVLLAAAAEKTLDAQYFIWNGDQVGCLLFEVLWKATERGVRVRLYNPLPHRGSRALGYMTDFGRLNRRMHNKSFTVDNQASVVGGRNIANEYFGAGRQNYFAEIR